MPADLYFQHVLDIASLTGGIAFAFSGFLIGVRKNLDIMGIFILAFLTANGGGMLRDVLIGHTPAILLNATPFWLTAGVLALASLFRLQRFAGIERNGVFVISDAIGLVAFGISGAMIGIAEQLGFFGVLVLSFLTATGGGIVRDLLVNEVPEILHADFYGSVALLLGAAVWLLHAEGLANPLTLLLLFLAALATRLVAYRLSWRLPKL